MREVAKERAGESFHLVDEEDRHRLSLVVLELLNVIDLSLHRVHRKLGLGFSILTYV